MLSLFSFSELSEDNAMIVFYFYPERIRSPVK